MSSDEFKPGKEIGKIFEDLREYFELRYDILKLEIAESLVKFLSGFYTFFVLVSLLLTAGMFFSFAAAYYFSELFHSFSIGFMLIGSFYLILIGIFLFFRKKHLTRFLIRFVSQIFFKKND